MILVIVDLAAQGQELLLQTALNELFESLIYSFLFGGKAGKGFRLLQKGLVNL